MKFISLKLLRSLCLDFIIFLVPALVIAFCIPYVLRLFLPFIAAFFLYLAANPLNKALSKYKLGRSFCAFLSLLIISVILALIIRIACVKLWSEIRSLTENSSAIYNSYAASLSIASEKLFSRAQNFPLQSLSSSRLDSLFLSFSETLQKQLGKLLTDFSLTLINVAKNIPALLLSVFTTVFTTFFLLKESDSVFTSLRTFFGEKVSGFFFRAKNTFFSTAASYFKAQLIIESIIFIILFSGFLLLKINYSFILALVTAIVDAVPVFGTGAILIPMALFNFLSGKQSLGWGILILYGIALLARQLCEPKIIGKKLGIHPLVTIFSIYVGMKLFGVLGLIFAPFAAVFIKILVFPQRESA